MDNGQLFVIRFFSHNNGHLGLNHLRIAAYHPQANGQAERYNRAIVMRLRHYDTSREKSWKLFVQPSTGAYITQVNMNANTSP